MRKKIEMRETYKTITDLMEFYSNRRMHSSLSFISPNEFYNLNFG
ncbi:hypothetical protein [Clostridium rhizosphaerae]|nr:hypothetical protein [Clostridium rhizosphaerae]